MKSVRMNFLVIRGKTRARHLALPIFRPVYHHTTVMGRTRMAYSEADIQRAITEYNSGLYPSKQAAAQANNVPPATLRYRLAGQTSPSQAHETRQILSNAEEKTLVRWITRFTSTGFPASPALVVEMADEIRRGRLQLSRSVASPARPIGEH